jgi:hypothetical protein
MTLLVRDEEDILESNLRFHHAQGVDFFIVMDHQSCDGTPEIVRKFRRRGLAELVNQPDPGYRQAEWVTWMARRAALEYGADWVINNDADEFWWPTEGTLRTTLAKIPARYAALYAPRFNFYSGEEPSSTTLRSRAKQTLGRIRQLMNRSGLASNKNRVPPGSSDFFEIMTLRDVSSVNSLGYPLPGKMCHRAHPDVEVAMGNHSVSFPDTPEICAHPLIEVLHFPVRSATQFCHKIAVGGAALQNSPEVPGGETWRVLFSRQNGQSAARYFRSTRLTKRKIEQMLAAGRFRQDTRLRDFLRGGGDGKPHVG